MCRSSYSQKKIAASNKLQDVGVRAWISVEEAELQLFTISECDRENALLAQVEFYRHVLCVKCPTKLFNKTKVGNNAKRVKLLWT